MKSFKNNNFELVSEISKIQNNTYFIQIHQTEIFKNYPNYSIPNKFNDKIIAEVLSKNDEKIINFYEYFNTVEKQSNSSFKNSDGLNAREAWGKLVENLPNVSYINTCNPSSDSSSEYKFEIKDGLNSNDKVNFFEVIDNLFPLVSKAGYFVIAINEKFFHEHNCLEFLLARKIKLIHMDKVHVYAESSEHHDSMNVVMVFNQ